MEVYQNGTFSTDQAAVYLGVKPSTIRAWVQKRRIPYVKVGRLTRFLQRDLDAFLEQGRIPAAS